MTIDQAEALYYLYSNPQKYRLYVCINDVYEKVVMSCGSFDFSDSPGHCIVVGVERFAKMFRIKDIRVDTVYEINRSTINKNLSKENITNLKLKGYIP